MSADLPLSPGTLWPQVVSQTQHALACGALQPIDTEFSFIEAGEMQFLVRILANLVRKETAKKKKDPNFNPFLPYDPDLFVAAISESHLCLLNKYNVVDHHILIVTREFEAQDSWLNLADFSALTVSLQEIDGLGFYNGGPQAGASQHHKHLQLIPLPLVPGGPPLPLDALIPGSLPPQPSQISLPFAHRIAGIAKVSGAALLHTYHQLVEALGIDRSQPAPPQPYNLLVTRRWMAVILRSQDSYEGIPVNSMGYAGSLLVKNSQQLGQLQQMGPMQLLRAVGCPEP